MGRDKLAQLAKDIADSLQLIENVKSLQVAQKEMADAIKKLGDRITFLEADMRALKAEAIKEAVCETQSIVNAVQGHLNKRMEDAAVRIALLEMQATKKLIDASPQKDGNSLGPS